MTNDYGTLETSTDRLKIWASILEPNTHKQAETLAEMPFIFPHVALMPDAHLGLGATVGSVIPTRKAIIPAAVGVDIGCGMIAVQTQFYAKDLEGLQLRALREGIEAVIPLSVGKNNSTITDSASVFIAELESSAQVSGFDPDSFSPTWREQLGSLGSGNHFIEVSLDEDDRVWLFLHSGSRGVGNRIAQKSIKVAQDLMERYYIELPDKDLAYLVEGTKEFSEYITGLQWAQNFALANREEMMIRVSSVFAEWIGQEVVESVRINCHHNYTERSKVYGEDVWLSRKGAIDASDGVMGLIPGSMGTRSYVVRGKGNPISLNSAPHGAGREYSRSAARKTFSKEQLQEAMVGIEYRDTDAFIDEIPAAYKDIDVIMDDSETLVEIVHTLRQIVNVKGD